MLKSPTLKNFRLNRYASFKINDVIYIIKRNRIGAEFMARTLNVSVHSALELLQIPENHKETH